MIFDKDPTADDRTGFDLTTPMIDAFNASRQEMLDQTRIVMREMQQTQGRALEYESFTTTVTPGGLTQVLGFDLSRLKMKLHAHGSGVYVGKRTQLAGGNQGYRLPAGSDIELTAVGELYAMVSGSPTTTRTNLAVDSAPLTTNGLSSFNASGTPTLVADSRFMSGSGYRYTFTAAPTGGWNLGRTGFVASGIEPGKTYTFSLYGLNTWAGATGGCTVQWYDASGNDYGYTSGTGVTMARANVPYRLTNTLVAPPGAARASVFYDMGPTYPAIGDSTTISSFGVELTSTDTGAYTPSGTSLPAPVALSVWVEKSAQ